CARETIWDYFDYW
nr:immunoglobulin heavy chain junction region [Mus musculus]MBK4195661.1 immunoglobulin heavy chain junction region [Mus musculus]